VGSFQGNPQRRVPIAQQWNQEAEQRHQGMFPSVSEVVAVVETLSPQGFHLFRGRETGRRLRLNLSKR
jgi:hypothetical protein